MYIQSYPDLNSFLSTVGENLSTGDSVVTLFPEILGCIHLNFLWIKLHKNLYTKYVSLKITMVQFGCIYLSRRLNSVFLKILVLILSRILLYEIVQNFACDLLALKDNIDIFFANRDCQGAPQSLPLLIEILKYQILN